jgi:hypothetical protein
MWKVQPEHATVPVQPVGTSHSNRPKTLQHQIQRLLIHARPRIGNGDANSFAAIL